MKVTYLAATSADGFIAKEDGNVAWLEELNVAPEETGLTEFFESIDGLVMGRKTYDFVFDHGSWPYGNKVTWVCTSTQIEPIAGANLKVVEGIDEVENGALEEGVKHLWLVGGGQLASAMLERGMITHVSISEFPIALGRGIPLFASHKLEDIVIQDRQEEQKNGFKQIRFAVDRTG